MMLPTLVGTQAKGYWEGFFLYSILAGPIIIQFHHCASAHGGGLCAPSPHIVAPVMPCRGQKCPLIAVCRMKTVSGHEQYRVSQEGTKSCCFPNCVDFAAGFVLPSEAVHKLFTLHSISPTVSSPISMQLKRDGTFPFSQW